MAEKIVVSRGHPMKLSIIIPAFNLEKYIEKCIRSVCEQKTNFDYEVIVCDDGSLDDTAPIISRLAGEFDNLVPFLKPVNGGLAANIRTLLSLASGEYIAYLDGDDLALPGKLQQQVDYLDQHPHCGMVYHESDMFDSESGETIKLYSQGHYNWSYISQSSQIEDLVRFGTYMQASAVMFRRHSYLSDTVLHQCKIILDYPLYIMNAGFLQGSIDFIPQVLGRYRIHKESFGGKTQKSVSRRLQSLEDLLFACDSSSVFEVDEAVISQGKSHHLFAAALYFLFRDNHEQFRDLISLSYDGSYFYDQRHAAAWQHKESPEMARKLIIE